MNRSSSKVPRLEMRGVRKRFGATAALTDVDITVQAGEVHALIGENGAGKSTLMKVLSGALPADAGAMKLDGSPYSPSHPIDARRAGVTMIYQELSLCPHLSVEDNILLAVEPARLGWINRREVRKRALDALKQLHHPEIRPDALVGGLPIAMQQLVEISRALAKGCRVLVLDEPTSSLAEDDVGRLFELVRRLAGEGLAVIYISHFIEEVQEVADRYTVLRDGFGVASGETADVSADQIVGLMIGRSLDQMYPVSRRTPTEPILSLDSLSGDPMPEAASLVLKRGEVLGIAGLVGSGRTELLRTIFGLEPVRSGSIRVAAFTGPAAPAARWQQGVGLLSEDRKNEGLAVRMNLADNMTLSRLTGLGPAGLIFPQRQAEAARTWIDRLDIRCRGPAQFMHELSGGNQQKVALARLLHHDVDLFLLDEPTRGIDVASKAQIYKLIDTLATGSAGQPPRAVLMVSSYLPELLGICDRVAVMCRGRLSPARPARQWDEKQLMLAATGQEVPS